MNYTEKLVYQSNYWYNDGLGKAKIRDMSGAITSLRKSLQYNRENIDARNLLGLVYYGRGEVAEALVEWILSKNLKSKENLAGYFINKILGAQSELETVNQAVKKFNQCLVYCEQDGEDLAIIQLKKVVTAHPTFLKAYQLLALLYLHTEQYAKANQVLKTARKLDTTNEMTLRYLHEITQKRKHRSKSKEVKQKAADSVSYKLGNETIIQPASASLKGAAIRIGMINLIVGVLAGAAVVWFLILPARLESNTQKWNKRIKEFSVQLEEQQAQISAQTKALDEYRGNSEKTEEAAATASSTKESYENLLTVYTQYQSGNYSSADMAETLLKVNRDSLGAGGQELYDTLSGNILTVVAERQYNTGVAAVQAQNYAGAVEALEQVIRIDEKYGNGNALYNLGLAYKGNGSADNAKKTFEKVIELFPNTEIATSAQTELDGGNTNTGSEGQ